MNNMRLRIWNHPFPNDPVRLLTFFRFPGLVCPESPVLSTQPYSAILQYHYWNSLCQAMLLDPEIFPDWSHRYYYYYEGDDKPFGQMVTSPFPKIG